MANFFLQCIFSTEAVDCIGLTLIGVLLTVVEGERRQGHDFFSFGSLQGRFTQVGAAELQATANSSCC
jgi:hypothetical protein